MLLFFFLTSSLAPYASANPFVLRGKMAPPSG